MEKSSPLEYLKNIHTKPIFTPLVLLLLGLACIALIGKEAGDFAIAVLTIMAILSILSDREDSNPLSFISQHVFMAVIMMALGMATVFMLTRHQGTPIAMRSVPLFLLGAYWLSRSGVAGIKSHWKEMLLLLVLAIPDRTLMTPIVAPILALADLPALSHLTAKLSAGITSMLGLPVELVDGNYIEAPNVISHVIEGCDGGRILDFMIRLTLMLILAFPVKRYKWPLILVVSMIVGFLVNAGRVSAMTFVANTGDMDAFHYWHTGEGSKIFNLIAIILFCLIGYFQITPPESTPEKA